MPDYAFPPALLEQSPESRLDYFKSFTIAHPLLREADAALKEAIQEPTGWSLIFVYGPTGVPALQTCARGARPTVARGLLRPLQALACCRF